MNEYCDFPPFCGPEAHNLFMLVLRNGFMSHYLVALYICSTNSRDIYICSESETVSHTNVCNDIK